MGGSFIFKNMSLEFTGDLLRHHPGALSYFQYIGKNDEVQNIFDACKALGKELIEEEKMSNDNLEKVSKELVPLEEYANLVNESFKNAVQQNNW